ncbi:sigma-70 family RNA polymerase sigma factor [bacterium]|nr:sigma-70 family RNA polymerase sigma factor [bacterium]
MPEFLDTLSLYSGGDPEAAKVLEPQVYEELRAIAAGLLRGERQDHTLQPTALVHEAYLRLVQSQSVPSRDRAHLLALCARVMRRILVDHARSRGAAKRGGLTQRVTWNESAQGGLDGSSTVDLDILDLNAALERLARVSERSRQVVELRFFGGLNSVEIAEVLGISARTVGNDWAFARAWLRRDLGKGTA